MATYPRSKVTNRPSPPPNPKAAKAAVGQVSQSRVSQISQISGRSIETASDVVEHMSAVINDLEDGLLQPQIGNAVCNAMSKLLKVVDMQYRYGLNGRSRLLLVESNGERQKTVQKESPDRESDEDMNQAEE